LPLSPASPALPAIDLRVAPKLASFGGADWPIHRLPCFPVFRYRRDPFLGLPRIPNLPAPADGSPSHPGSRTIRLCHRRISRSPRSFLSFDYASSNELPGCPGSSFLPATSIGQFPGCPKSWVSRRCRLTDFRVAPNLCPSAPLLLPRVAPIPHPRLGR
jgi:hypothetical protein